MRIIGCLNWYAEQPAMLAEYVQAMAQAQVDHLVAVDGAYSLYPNPQPASTPEEHEALHDTTHAHGIGLTIHTPPEPWQGNEIEKKTVMFAIAHRLAEAGNDWLFPVDADELVLEPNGYQRILAKTDHDVATIMHWEQGVRARKERRLFRTHPQGITVQRAHYLFYDGDGRCLWGPTQIPAHPLDMQIRHRPWDRTEQRRTDRNQYYDYRLQNHAEIGL